MIFNSPKSRFFLIMLFRRVRMGRIPLRAKLLRFPATSTPLATVPSPPAWPKGLCDLSPFIPVLRSTWLLPSSLWALSLECSPDLLGLAFLSFQLLSPSQWPGCCPSLIVLSALCHKQGLTKEDRKKGGAGKEAAHPAVATGRFYVREWQIHVLGILLWLWHEKWLGGSNIVVIPIKMSQVEGTLTGLVSQKQPCLDCLLLSAPPPPP